MADQTLPPGSFETPTIAPLYVDGLPLSELTQSLSENRLLLASQRAASQRQFWSTPRRSSTDPTREVYEVSLNVDKQVNHVAFDLARFPHRGYLFHRSGVDGKWQPTLNRAGRQVVTAIRDSIPTVLTPPPPGSQDHPQHYGAGHWVRHEVDLAPTKARQFRLVLVRQHTDSIPTDRVLKPVTYSLGVRDFEIGYRVASRADIPETPRSPLYVTERQPFATTTDLLGSPVEIGVRENRAHDLLSGASWKSEPQPIQNAVVNLYVDARDGQGEGQVVDRFYLEPVTSGVSLNLYYSNDTPRQVGFAASDNPVVFPSVREVGATTHTPSGIDLDAVGYVDVDNAAIQFNPTKPFWLASSITPAFGPADPAAHPLFAAPGLSVVLEQGALKVSLFDATVIYTRPPVSEEEEGDLTTVDFFEAGQQFSYAVGYDGANLLVYVDGNLRTTRVDNPRPTPQPPSAAGLVAYLRLGGRPGDDDVEIGSGSHRLNAFSLKVEAPPAGTMAQAVQETDSWVRGDLVGATTNAVLRYLPEYQGAVNPAGFVGGVADRYDDLVWTPVNRDFRLAKGFIHFNPTKARYFKFEFTNLAVAPYDDYTPVIRRVKVFPTAEVYRRAAVTASSNTAGGAISALQSAAGTMFFSDQARLYSLTRPIQPSSSYIPTKAAYSTDPSVASALRQRSVYLNLQAWHSRRFTPRFVHTQRHEYEVVEVQHTQRVAFFVALSKIEMYRADYQAADDTDQYLEPFDDSRHLVVDSEGNPDGGWLLGEGWLSTPDILGVEDVATATSRVFASQRKVTGIQFASQQTPPVQLLPDADLDDDSLLNWRGYGDARIEPSQSFTSDIGTMSLVSRNARANFWTTIEQRYDSWDRMEQDGLSWDALESTGDVNPEGGISSAQAYPVSAQGRLYAAARVYATKDLTSPLYIQVVSEDGQVLSEEPMVVRAGQVVEGYTSYTIGEGGASDSLSWDEVEALGTWGDLEALGTWDQVSQTSEGYRRRIGARVVQVEPTADSWYVDNISLFNDAIVWEFSNDGGKTFYPAYDIRNNPHGAFLFPGSSDETAGRSLVWRVKGARAKQRIDYLAVRPLYDSLPLGQPYRETIQTAGPNLALVDHYSPIQDDPKWRLWHQPIPEEWWFLFRQWLLEQRGQSVDSGYVRSTIVLPETITPMVADRTQPPAATGAYAPTAIFVNPTNQE